MNQNELYLGVNIDHVATLRQARGTLYPDPIYAALEAEIGGADGITLHMREDLRHIQPRDVKLLREVLQTRMNLELAVTPEMLRFAEEIKPHHACLVPEKRAELTTEGGLDVVRQFAAVKEAVAKLMEVTDEVSLFIDPDFAQIDAAKACHAVAIELHTGAYADAKTIHERQEELTRIRQAAQYAANLNLVVNAGHGLHYHNVRPIAALKDINELNIGHAIIARSIFVGIKEAVKEMRQLMQEARFHGN